MRDMSKFKTFMQALKRTVPTLEPAAPVYVDTGLLAPPLAEDGRLVDADSGVMWQAFICIPGGVEAGAVVKLLNDNGIEIYRMWEPVPEGWQSLATPPAGP
jgi:hypothetical protein